MLVRNGHNDVRTRLDLAITYQRIGDTLGNPGFSNLGDKAAALENYRKMQAIFEDIATADPNNRDARHSVALGHEKFGRILETDHKSEALGHYRRFQEIMKDLVAADPANTQLRRDLAMSDSDVGSMLEATGDPAGSLESYRQALGIFDALSNADPTNVAAREDLQRFLNRYAWTLLTCKPANLRRPSLALQYARRAVDLNHGQSPNALDTLALAYDEVGDRYRAVETEEKALALLTPDSSLRNEFSANLARFKTAGRR